MKFCIVCKSVMLREISADSRIIYTCTCGEQVLGRPEDSLMYEEFIEKKDIQAVHEVLIENAAHDPARSLVARQCPECKIDRITQIFIPPDMQAIYACTCGYKSSYIDK